MFSFDDSIIFSIGSKENILWDVETQNKVLDLPVHTAVRFYCYENHLFWK